MFYSYAEIFESFIATLQDSNPIFCIQPIDGQQSGIDQTQEVAILSHPTFKKGIDIYWKSHFCRRSLAIMYICRTHHCSISYTHTRILWISSFSDPVYTFLLWLFVLYNVISSAEGVKHKPSWQSGSSYISSIRISFKTHAEKLIENIYNFLILKIAVNIGLFCYTYSLSS